MMLESLRQLDATLFFLLNGDLRNGLFDLVMPVITGRAEIIVLPFLIAFLIKEKRKAITVFAVSFFSVLLADGTAFLIKDLAGRERPCSVLENVHLLVGCGKSFSMPSNHATNAFAFAVPFLFMTRNRLKYIFLFIALLVSLSRVSVGVHYPSDVIVGAGIGVLLSMGVVRLYGWFERRFPEKPFSTAMYLFLIVISLFRLYYILCGPLDLNPDEAHYWEWSRRLDLSYYSKGPMIAYLIAVSTSIFGDNEFGVRVFAVLFSSLSSIFLYKLGREMFNERVGASSAMLFQIIPLYSTFGIIFTIDSPFIFFWILSLYFFWKAVNSQVAGKSGSQDYRLSTIDYRLYWLLLGITVGLGLLTKYTMAFFYVSAFLFLVLSPQHRRTLGTPAPYTALLISLLLFSPVVIWNAQHDWVTIRHTAGQAHVADGLMISPKSFLEFVGSQLGVLTPILFVMIMIALWKIRGEGGFVRRGETSVLQGKFLFWFSLPVVGFFILKSLQGKVQANWAMMGYIAGLIAFSEVFVNRWEHHKTYLKKVIVAGVALSLTGTAIAHYPSEFGLPPKLDPSAGLKGWEELGKEVSAIHEEMKKRGEVFIFSDRYQVASSLAFYVKGHPVTYFVNLGRRMNQYDLWPGLDGFIHYSGIFVRINDVEMPPKLRSAFGVCEKRTLRVDDRGKPLRKYSLFLCGDFKGMEKEAVERY